MLKQQRGFMFCQFNSKDLAILLTKLNLAKNKG